MSGCGTPDEPIRIGEVNHGGNIDSFPCLVLSGNPRQRGLMYGLLLRDKIKANVARQLGHPFFPPWDVCLYLIQRFYIPGMRKYWPSGLEELEGMAQGSGVYLEHLMLLNARDDLTVGRRLLADGMGESTSAFFSQLATADYVPLLAHSWTSSKYKHDQSLIVCLEIQFTAVEELPNIFMVTEAGMISGCGINAHGVAVVGNRLISSDDCMPSRTPAFPVACLDRLILERAGDKIDPCELQDVVFDAIDRYASRHLLIASNRGHALSIELSVELGYIYRGKPGSNAKIHTNHFQSFEAFLGRRETWDASRGGSSQFRLARLTDLIDNHGSARLSMQQIVDTFSDHDGSPESICQHREDNRDNMTIGFVMFDTNRLVISVCKGPPCLGALMHFTFQREGNGGSAEDEGMGDAGNQSEDATGQKRDAATQTGETIAHAKGMNLDTSPGIEPAPDNDSPAASLVSNLSQPSSVPDDSKSETRSSSQHRETSATKRKNSSSSSVSPANTGEKETSAATENQEMVDCRGARKRIRIQLGDPVEGA
ncbi:hypothetical protein MYCTH_2302672 [Thermothelomyces thermophilus ATCC 42464]|uniref:Peptidase C45 hydrolase domain-containing protein n=1 Tax=Thermothelomyces thermophilus (strain ATCC 42464 / BCRC 31852 / DSM 1799) TaxID=573729 RepID=G2Q850_THET4|nr:uncharacterized protein MYCTH_2302672 [Thermothelomyces thermophilus ATCC 42464]AEO57007.1 hypothetical protein MYCTH_2302672 [Thermothelomyces thermophilus ATCC 42464]